MIQAYFGPFPSLTNGGKGHLADGSFMRESVSLGLAPKQKFPLSGVPGGEHVSTQSGCGLNHRQSCRISRFFVPCGMSSGDRSANQELVWSTACVWTAARIQLMEMLLYCAGESAINVVAGDRELPRRQVVDQVS